MIVRIDTDDVQIVVRDGRVTNFNLKGEKIDDLEKFMGGLAQLTKAVDEMYIRTVEVAHLNHAINTRDDQELVAKLKMLNDGWDLHCNCKNCFLSYVRGFIEINERNQKVFADNNPLLYLCLQQDRETD